MNIQELDFEKGNGLLPAIIQDHSSGAVLMLGYMNHAALEQTEKTGRVTFYSRSKERLWTKGETSGNYLIVKDLIKDCDNDTLLLKVDPQGPVCHTGQDTCFGDIEGDDWQFLKKLESIIADRKQNPVEGSYTTSLFDMGINKIAQKVGEEAVEVVIESKDQNDDLFKNETADLLFHLMILLEEKGCKMSDIAKILETRHGK